MSPLEYHRPKTLEEALELLQKGIPLAGGTAITPRRREIVTVIDLLDLGLDQLETQDGFVLAGAGVKLQALVEAGGTLPAALKTAGGLEAGWNLRNMATLGGSVMTSDGRSPLLTALLALDPTVHLEPGDETVSLDKLLDIREQRPFQRLITRLQFKRPITLLYEQVSRAPADRPLVCAAVGRLPSEMPDGSVCVVVGGFGTRPIRVRQSEDAIRQGGGVDAAADAACDAYREAEDHWASAAYRSHVAGVLVRRLLRMGIV